VAAITLDMVEKSLTQPYEKDNETSKPLIPSYSGDFDRQYFSVGDTIQSF
jgi:hypothetical protein